MQTTQGIGVHSRQLHKHKHVLTFTAMIEVEAWNLGESEWAHFPRAGRDACVQAWEVTMCDSRHVRGIILGVWTRRIWYYFRTVIINRFISSEKWGIECSGRLSPSWNYIPDAEGHLSCLICTEMRASNECPPSLLHIQKGLTQGWI